MREILFRGKRIDNGERVYGNLNYGTIEIKSIKDSYYISDFDVNPWDKKFYPVIPESVGQYTGLTDNSVDLVVDAAFASAYDNGHNIQRYPITEIPTPHGRLIDADALLRVIEENSYRLRGVTNSTENGMFLTGIRQAIDESPTIIEAEK